MREFKVLPTDPTFQALTGDQVEFIMANMEEDNNLRELAAKGYDPDSYYEDVEDSWWDTPIDEFNPLGLLEITPEEIQAQIDAITSEEDKRAREEAMGETMEWADHLENVGNDQEEQTVRQVIKERIREAQEDAAKRSGGNVRPKSESPVAREEQEPIYEEIESIESMEEAIKIFENEDSFGPDGDWI